MLLIAFNYYENIVTFMVKVPLTWKNFAVALVVVFCIKIVY